MKRNPPCYVAAIDEFVGRAWLMRQIGCFPKRKFTTDLSLIKKIYNLINKEGVPVAIYPEARFSFAGVTEDIGDTLGKMAKLCKCRVIVVNQKGNFLHSPKGKIPHPLSSFPIFSFSSKFQLPDPFLSSHFLSFPWHFHGIGQHTMTKPDL